MHELFTHIASGGKAELQEIVDAFGSDFELFHRLSTTVQDPGYHAEGDVWIHTEMVLDECYNILASQNNSFSPEERLSFVLGASLHDIAKPLTTRQQIFEGVERIVSPRHADRGRSYIALKLVGLGLSPAVVRDIMMIVGHHHDPKKLVRRTSPAHAYQRLARIASSQLLYYFEIADMKGRICEDKTEQLELLEMFRLFSEEANAWNPLDPYKGWETIINEETEGMNPKTQEFIHEKAMLNAEAGIIMTPHEEIARSYAYRDSYPELYVLCGPSGSGKSSWIETHSEGCRVISLDQIREEITGKRTDQSKNGQAIQLAKETLREGLRKHDRIIWDATSLNREQRGGIIQLGVDYHARVTLIVFQLPESVLRERNQAREHPVPTQVLDRQLQKFDFPYRNEAHRVIYLNQEGEEIPEMSAVNPFTQST